MQSQITIQKYPPRLEICTLEKHWIRCKRKRNVNNCIKFCMASTLFSTLLAVPKLNSVLQLFVSMYTMPPQQQLSCLLPSLLSTIPEPWWKEVIIAPSWQNILVSKYSYLLETWVMLARLRVKILTASARTCTYASLTKYSWK